MVQIMPVENGYLITAYMGRQGMGSQDTFDMLNTVFSSVGKSDDPIAAFKKSLDQAKLKSSTRRKPIEHHIARTADEAVGLVREILGTMKV
jgi:hypothetical protein